MGPSLLVYVLGDTVCHDCTAGNGFCQCGEENEDMESRCGKGEVVRGTVNPSVFCCAKATFPCAGKARGCSALGVQAKKKKFLWSGGSEGHGVNVRQRECCVRDGQPFRLLLRKSHLPLHREGKGLFCVGCAGKETEAIGYGFCFVIFEEWNHILLKVRIPCA